MEDFCKTILKVISPFPEKGEFAILEKIWINYNELYKKYNRRYTINIQKIVRIKKIIQKTNIYLIWNNIKNIKSSNNMCHTQYNKNDNINKYKK